MAYFERKWGKYKLSESRKKEIFENNSMDYDEMVKEMSRITHLPKCICSLVYDAEEFILEQLGLIHDCNKE